MSRHGVSMMMIIIDAAAGILEGHTHARRDDDTWRSMRAEKIGNMCYNYNNNNDRIPAMSNNTRRAWGEINIIMMRLQETRTWSCYYEKAQYITSANSRLRGSPMSMICASMDERQCRWYATARMSDINVHVAPSKTSRRRQTRRTSQVLLWSIEER